MLLDDTFETPLTDSPITSVCYATSRISSRRAQRLSGVTSARSASVA